MSLSLKNAARTKAAFALKLDGHLNRYRAGASTSAAFPIGTAAALVLVVRALCPAFALAFGALALSLSHAPLP